VTQVSGLDLVDATTTPLGLAVHTYAVAGPPTFETYDPAVHTFAEHP
jgi:hypothetical protein